MELECLHVLEQEAHLAQLGRVQLAVAAAWGEKANKAYSQHVRKTEFNLKRYLYRK